MSTNLFWQTIEPRTKTFSKELKRIISPHIFGHDGGFSSGWIEIDTSWIPYFQGVADANEQVRNETCRLIELIEKHNKIQLGIF